METPGAEFSDLDPHLTITVNGQFISRHTEAYKGATIVATFFGIDNDTSVELFSSVDRNNPNYSYSLQDVVEATNTLALIETELKEQGYAPRHLGVASDHY